MMPELPSPPKLALILILAIFGFTFGPLIEWVQERRRQKYVSQLDEDKREWYV